MAEREITIPPKNIKLLHEKEVYEDKVDILARGSDGKLYRYRGEEVPQDSEYQKQIVVSGPSRQPRYEVHKMVFVDNGEGVWVSQNLSRLDSLKYRFLAHPVTIRKTLVHDPSEKRQVDKNGGLKEIFLSFADATKRHP